MRPLGRRIGVDSRAVADDATSEPAADPAAPSPLPARPQPVLDLPMTRVDGSTCTVAECLLATDTDAFVVVHGGELVAQWYRTPEDADAEHALMSITKSVIGCIAGVLIASGELEPDRLAVDYVPELSAGGYARATVRDLLDMRTACVTYHEDYEDPGGELARIGAAVEEPLPPLPDGILGEFAGGASTLRDIVATAPAPDPRPEATQGAPAVPFCYRSLDTDALGWVLERAGGRPILDAILELLRPLRLEAPGSISVDTAGVPQCSGGLALTARDVARFGLMLLHGGAVGDTQVVPSAFVKDTRSGGPDSAEAMLARVGHVLGPGAGLPGDTGFYRNQFWVPERGTRSLLCLGIHGQLVLVDSADDTVVVKLSTWPTAQDPARFSDGLECARTIARQLGGKDPSHRRDVAYGSSTAPTPPPRSS